VAADGAGATDGDAASGAVPAGVGPDETIPFAEAVERHDDVSVDPEAVSQELVVWEERTVTEVLAEVRDYFAAAGGEFEPPSDEFIVDQWFDFSYLDDYEVVSREWVNAPFAYISILYDDEENEYHYHVTEPVLDGFERYVRRDLVGLLRDNLMYQDFDTEGERETVFRREARQLIDDHAATVEDGSLHKLLYYLLRDFIHYGPIDPIMRDGAIEDISCDGTNVPVFVYHREHRDLRTNVSFDRDRLDSFTFRLAQRAGKQLSVSNPLVDASLPNGSRVQLTLGGDVSTRGSNFTIRKFADIPYTPVDLIAWNTFSAAQMAYFWLAIENNKSLIFAGGTGSGKTTSMNAISFFIPPSSKVVTIEDTREIDLPHDNWIQSVTRGDLAGSGQGEVSMYALLQAALRQRPEYLLVGEIRTEERVALTFFQAMSTGHTAYTTVHADSVESVLGRLRNPPLNVPVQLLGDLDIVSIQGQATVDERRVRRNQTVAEITDTAGTDIHTRTIFDRDAKTDTYERQGQSVVLAEIAENRGWDEERLERELEERERILQYLLDHELRGYEEVARTIQLYSRNPERVMNRIEADDLSPDDLVDEGPDIDTIEPSDLGAEETFTD
jgi:flagellar protein FlaI